MISTLAGRPMSRLSAISASKNARARRGASSTRVRDTSTWRIEISHQYPPSWSLRPNGIGSRCSHRWANTSIVPGASGSAISPSTAGSPRADRLANASSTWCRCSSCTVRYTRPPGRAARDKLASTPGQSSGGMCPIASMVSTASNWPANDSSWSEVRSRQTAMPRARAGPACPPTGPRPRPGDRSRPASESTCPSRTAHPAPCRRAGSSAAPGHPCPLNVPGILLIATGGSGVGVVAGHKRRPALSQPHLPLHAAPLTLPGPGTALPQPPPGRHPGRGTGQSSRQLQPRARPRSPSRPASRLSKSGRCYVGQGR
jgi:hypothetical protein